MEENGNVNGLSDKAYNVFQCVIPFIQNSSDRAEVSLVFKKLYMIEGVTRSKGQTRNHVTITFCYSTTPERLRLRFKNLRSLSVSGSISAGLPEATGLIDVCIDLHNEWATISAF
ncbi:unnamed protein product, partial [Ilex paraguariensis]